MEASEITNLALGATVIGLVFKAKLKILGDKAINRLIGKNKTAENIRELQIEVGDALYEYRKTTQAELNHIKGQLQELLQGQKAGQDPRIAEINGDVKALFERLNMVAKQVSDAQGSVEYVEAAVKAEAERNSTKLYSEGLAGLANACSAILERQVASEKLLSDIVNVLTQRND